MSNFNLRIDPEKLEKACHILYYEHKILTMYIGSVDSGERRFVDQAKAVSVPK